MVAKDKLFAIHQKNIQFLAIKVFKVKTNLLNVIKCNFLKARTLTYNLQSQSDFVSDYINTWRYGLNWISYFIPEVWDMIPSEIKNVNSLQTFETKIWKWALEIFSRYLGWPELVHTKFRIYWFGLNFLFKL